MRRYLVSYFTLTDCGVAFVDSVSGKSVRYYRDRFGDVWMKDCRWGTFRVEARAAIGSDKA